MDSAAEQETQALSPAQSSISEDVSSTYTTRPTQSNIIPMSLLNSGPILPQVQTSSLITRFNPPLYLQRYRKVSDLLASLEVPCTSLLDVGTSSGEFLIFLCRDCSDALPLTYIVGLDPDTEALSAAHNLLSQLNEDATRIYRWRQLSVQLALGRITSPLVENSKFDCITALEVLEHLDPPDVAALWQRCLGDLRPRYFIVTTPNRDFNPVFGRCAPGQSFQRPGIDYTMRHPDHRFEMSRAEFQSWARLAGETYCYEVSFHGAGYVPNAFQGQEWREAFPEEDLLAVFGPCTQIVLFSAMNDYVTPQAVSGQTISSAAGPEVQMLEPVVFPCEPEDIWPPTRELLTGMITVAQKYFVIDAVEGRLQEEHTSQQEVSTTVRLETIWDLSYDIKIVCHFRFDVLYRPLQTLLGQTIWDRTLQSVDVADVEYSTSTDGVDSGYTRAQLQSVKLLESEDDATAITVLYTYTLDHTNDTNDDDQDWPVTPPDLTPIEIEWEMPLTETTLNATSSWQ